MHLSHERAALRNELDPRARGGRPPQVPCDIWVYYRTEYVADFQSLCRRGYASPHRRWDGGLTIQQRQVSDVGGVFPPNPLFTRWTHERRRRFLTCLSAQIALDEAARELSVDYEKFRLLTLFPVLVDRRSCGCGKPLLSSPE